jgi:hypothetical protein
MMELVGRCSAGVDHEDGNADLIRHSHRPAYLRRTVPVRTTNDDEGILGRVVFVRVERSWHRFRALATLNWRLASTLCGVRATC